MTKEKIAKTGSDAWVDSSNQTKNHGDSQILKVQGNSIYTYLYAANPAPKNAKSTPSSILRLHANGTSSGSRTITAELVAPMSGKKKGWDQGKINWKNAPDVLSTPSAVTVTVGTLADGDAINIPVTPHIQSVMNGTKFYGWRIKTSSSTGHSFYAFKSGKHAPRLIVDYSHQPPVPAGLSPAGVISVAKPRVKFDASLLDLGDVLSLRVQIDAAGNFTSPGWDSGTVASTVPELDLSATSYPGLADGTSTQWRVGVLGDDSTWRYSLPVTMSRVNFPALTLTTTSLTSPTPEIDWTFTPQAAFQVTVDLTDTGAQVYDSGKTAGADQAFTIPEGVVKVQGEAYTVKVRTFDTQAGRVTGDASVVASRDLTYTPSTSITPATTISVTQIDHTPGVHVVTTRATTPDSWALEVDGVIVKADIDPADTVVSTGVWAYDWWGASAFNRHAYRMVPVEGGVAASAGPAAALTHRIKGTWLIDVVSGARFNMLNESHSLAFIEEAEVTPKAGQGFARDVTSMRGIEGEVSGVLVAESTEDSRSLAEQLADVYAIKGFTTSRMFRFAMNDLNMRCWIGSVSPSISTDFVEHIPQRAVSYWVGQDVSDLPYTVHV